MRRIQRTVTAERKPLTSWRGLWILLSLSLALPAVGAGEKASHDLEGLAEGQEEHVADSYGYDTCLIIRDPDRFINQVGLALRRELPGWSIDVGKVLYLPDKAFFSRHPTYHDIFYAKPWSYRHQREIRIVCSPPTLVPKLQPRTIYAGSIADEWIRGRFHPALFPIEVA